MRLDPSPNPSPTALLRRLRVGVLGFAALAAGAAGPPAAAEVRAVLFYAPDCTQCDDFFAYYLPVINEHYGARLAIAGIDASQEQGAALYGEAASRHGLPAEWPNVPAVAVADRLVAGPEAIVMTLGDNFEALAGDPSAAIWPDLAGLPALLEHGIAYVRERLNEAPQPLLAEPGAVGGAEVTAGRDDIANKLAIAVLIGMLLTLMHSLVRVRRPGRGRQLAWLWIPLASLVGLGISAYTGYTSVVEVDLMCGPIGSCNAVQQSEYAKPFGIPMGILGLLGYGALLAAWIMGRRLSPDGGAWRWGAWLIALGGTLFSIRLTYLEPFVIGHTCLWCLGSAVTITLILWLLSGETRAPTRPAAD